MEKNYIENKTFEKIEFNSILLAKADYENCVFLHCGFSGLDLSNLKFTECEFVNCNLSLAILTKTSFREIKFKDCKMLGLHFDDCNEFLFELSFDHCQLNLSSFYKLNLKKTVFKNCSLHEIDFTEADLTGSVFNNCDLHGAAFMQTILEKSDLRTSFNFIIDPEINRIKKAKFSKEGIIGLLDKYDIEID